MDPDGIQSVRNRNVNARFMFNGTEKDINSFRQMSQENLKDFHNKTQFCKSELQSFLYPSSVGHVIYYANNIQSKDIIENVLKLIEKENGSNIEISINQEAAFQTKSERKIFYKNYNRLY